MVRQASGNTYIDERGKLLFNNDIDLSVFKRLYLIENANCDVVRGWQGHKIERRLFFATKGKFLIKVVKIDDFVNPSDFLDVEQFILDATTFDSLYVENGYATCIQAISENSQLMAFSDYLLGEVDDNYKYDLKKWK